MAKGHYHRRRKREKRNNKAIVIILGNNYSCIVMTTNTEMSGEEILVLLEALQEYKAARALLSSLMIRERANIQIADSLIERFTPPTQHERFVAMTGREPEQDDLERTFCGKAGEEGHYDCGICSEHNKPRFICGCLVTKEKR